MLGSPKESDVIPVLSSVLVSPTVSRIDLRDLCRAHLEYQPDHRCTSQPPKDVLHMPFLELLPQRTIQIYPKNMAFQ